MTPLTQEFVNNCPIENGFRLRGMDMTRIEVFVDAAFAFSVTMLMISYDSIPTSFAEMVLAIKGIPAFIFSVSQLVWIWYTHNIWSKRYGLDNAATVALSTALLIVILIYIYPMRIMLEGMFTWLTNGYLSSVFTLNSLQEVMYMFVFLGIGFVTLSLIFVLMHRYAASLKNELRLNQIEMYETKTIELLWLTAAGVGLTMVLVALFIPQPLTPFSGFVLALLGVLLPWVRYYREKSAPSTN